MIKRILVLSICLWLWFLATGCSVSEAPPVTPTAPTIPSTEPQTVPTQTEQTVPPTELSTQPSVITEPTEATEPTEQATEPVDPNTLWTPNCQEYIYLRDTPGGTIIDTIPVNEMLTLHGWEGKYALVTYNGKQGYATANYIKPADPNYLGKRLQIVTLTTKYTYEQMLADMAALQAQYPDAVHTAVIGTSEEGRDIPVLQIGDLTAKKHILLQGAIHGREHFTACLLMALADSYLFQGPDADVCYHIIPMSNPDGVILSQTGKLNAAQKAIYQQDLASGHTTLDENAYTQYWKANALGVDLNRNFPSGWEDSLEHTEASSEKFRGVEPFSAAESRALRDYTQQYSFCATLSFHSSGSVLYYQYADRQPVNKLSYSLALAAQDATGYIPVSTDGTSGAGYKDWAMDALGIPSLTVEIGNNITPLPERDLYSTFARCEGLFPAINSWVKSQ